MNLNNQQILVSYLERHGYAEESRGDIAKGFDFSKPVYEQDLDDRTIIYQFVRNSSAQYPLQKLGNWFYLQGADMPGLAIFSGGEGRSVATVRVDVRFTALEGTSTAMSRNWRNSIGGKGGMTQIFVPDVYIRSNLRILGYGETGCDLGSQRV